MKATCESTHRFKHRLVKGRHQRFAVAWDKLNGRFEDKRACMATARQAADG